MNYMMDVPDNDEKCSSDLKNTSIPDLLWMYRCIHKYQYGSFKKWKKIEKEIISRMSKAIQ